MSPRLRRWRLALLAAVVLTPGLLLSGASAGTPSDASGGPVGASAVPHRPGPPATGPADPGRARSAQTPPGPATPDRPAAPAGRPGPGARPKPYVQDFARQPGVRPRPPLPSPTGPHRVSTHLDGCDHNYGSRGQCVPWKFPPGTTDRCAWLAAHGFGPLPVAGSDRLRLDRNRDGTACGPGDR